MRRSLARGVALLRRSGRPPGEARMRHARWGVSTRHEARGRAHPWRHSRRRHSRRRHSGPEPRRWHARRRHTGSEPWRRHTRGRPSHHHWRLAVWGAPEGHTGSGSWRAHHGRSSDLRPRHHHARCRAADAACRACQSRRCLPWCSHWQASPCSPAHAWSTRSNLASRGCVVLWGRTLDGHGDDFLASQHDQPKDSALLPLLLRFPLLWRQAPELLRVSQHQVQMPIKGHEPADNLPRVQQRDSHSVVDIMQELR